MVVAFSLAFLLGVGGVLMVPDLGIVDSSQSIAAGLFCLVAGLFARFITRPV